MKSITPDSLYDIILLDDVRVSPDGRRAVFVRTSVDRSGNKYNRTIWLKDLVDFDTPAQPLTGGTKDGSPRWNHDGKQLGFISGRDDKPQVFVLPMSGGEARSLTSHLNGVNAFEWSPDDERIAFTANMRRDECEKEIEEAKHKDDGRRTMDDGSSSSDVNRPSSFKEAWDLKREKEQMQHEEELRLDPRIVSRMPYRTGMTFIEDRYAHIYITDTPQNQSFADFNPNSTKPRRLTPNDSVASFAAPQWSADGKSLFSVYTRDPDSGELFRYADIVRFKSDGCDRRFERIPVRDFSCYDPLPSPDGEWLAFDRSFDDPNAYQPGTLAIMPSKGGDVVDLTHSLDRSLGQFKWSPDGRYLYFTLLSEGATTLYRVRIDQREGKSRSRRAAVIGKVERLTDTTHEISSFDMIRGGRVVFIASTPDDPCALFLLERSGEIRALYRPNAKFLSEHAIGQVEEVSYESDGRTIQGWLVKPSTFDKKKRYPLVVQMHGGPHVMWGAATRSNWHEFQAMVGAGYVVFYCNPCGSDGYGRDFWHANRGNWGDGPMRDVLRGVDLVVSRGYVDPKRLCITGGSYAGYLTAWIIGRDHRFAAACAQRGVYNLVSMRNTTDIPFFNDREAGGVTPWDDVQELWRQSPISLVPHIQTPLLIEHSEQDYRVPMEQAEQLFQAMKLMKKTVELVRWPREGHELSRAGEPTHRAERIRRIIEWFNEHTGNKKGG